MLNVKFIKYHLISQLKIYDLFLMAKLIFTIKDQDIYEGAIFTGNTQDIF